MNDRNREYRRAQSARALLWTSVLLGFLGLIVISPAGRLLFLAVATLFAAIAMFLGQGRARTVGMVVTLVLLVFCVVTYPAYREHMDHYLEQAESQH